MRSRSTSLAVLILALVAASTAHAAPADQPSVDDPTAQGPLDDLPAALADAVDASTDAAATSTGSAATGVSSMVGALAAAAAAAAHALATGASAAGGAVVHGVTSAAAALVSAVLATSHAIQASAAWTAAVAAAGVHLVAQAGLAVAHALATGTHLLAAALASGAMAVASAVGTTAATGLALAATLVASVAGTLVAGVEALATAPAARQHAAAGGAVGVAGTAGALQAWHHGLRQTLHRALRHGFLAPLYSRLDRDELLDHDVRRAIFDHVRTNPGAHTSAIADEVDVGWGTVVYHLERLDEARLLVSERHGNHRCFFVNGDGVPEAAREAIPLLKNETSRRVVDHVRTHPGTSQKDVGEALDMSPALVSWHVKRLAEAGILRKERQGRGNALHVERTTAEPAMRAVRASADPPAAPA